jgi:hypothetical protein
MPAVEYGSYYWCVVLNQRDRAAPEYVHLQSDEKAIEPNGCLTFRRAGRRPAGSEPKKIDAKQEGKSSTNTDDKKNKAGEDSKEADQSGKQSNLVYVSFGSDTWRAVYAAKLRDGSPASIEHWTAGLGSSAGPAGVYPNAGAIGVAARE